MVTSELSGPGARAPGCSSSPARPSRRTVHAALALVSQPTCVPESARGPSRSACTRAVQTPLTLERLHIVDGKLSARHPAFAPGCASKVVGRRIRGRRQGVRPYHAASLRAHDDAIGRASRRARRNVAGRPRRRIRSLLGPTAPRRDDARQDPLDHPLLRKPPVARQVLGPNVVEGAGAVRPLIGIVFGEAAALCWQLASRGILMLGRAL